MRAPFANIAVVVALVSSAACTTATDDGIVLPLGQAERARELKLVAEPPVRRITRDADVTEKEKDAATTTDDVLHTQQDAYGRLGFFARDFDPRSTARAASAYYGAYYDHHEKNITVIDKADDDLLVHELTHALQDQHFDLTRLFATATSSDEAMALRALVEGDAVMAQVRSAVWSHGFPAPSDYVATEFSAAKVRETSETILNESPVPLIFVARPAFAYSYGAAYVASRIGVARGAWALGSVNELLASRGPVSTQEILRGGAEVDAILPVGFGALPAAVSAAYVPEMVDRIGEWYIYLLLHPLWPGESLPPSAAGDGTRRAPASARDAARLASAWDGDQLLLLRKKDGATAPSKSGPSAIVWTTVWDSAEVASDVAAALSLLHRLEAAPELGDYAYVAKDGEVTWLETRGTQICFIKNLEPALMPQTAHVALSTADERRMDIVRQAAELPLVH